MTTTESPRTAQSSPSNSLMPSSRVQRSLLWALGGVLLMSVVRQITGADDLTSAGTAGAALRLAVPIGLAALGAMYSERSGIVNIGLEGMMILGTWFGAWAAFEFGPWWGVLAGIVGGAIGGLIHAVATVTFDVDHIVSGVAINILGVGAARYLSVLAFDPADGGGPTQSPNIPHKIGDMSLPFLSGGNIFGWHSPDLLGWIDKKNVFFLSDLSGILSGVTKDVNWVTLLAVALLPISTFVLWRTRFGLRLRACGENPASADSLGVNVRRYRYAGVVISGGFAGLGGAFLSTVASSIYREGQTAGRGFIGLATVIFGNWRPGGIAMGAGLFGFADALNLRSDEAVRALLLLVAIILALVAIRQFTKNKTKGAVVSAVFAALFLVAYITIEKVPSQITYCTPYVVTLLVLTTSAQKLRPPAKSGQSYRKGSAG